MLSKRSASVCLMAIFVISDVQAMQQAIIPEGILVIDETETDHLLHTELQPFVSTTEYSFTAPIEIQTEVFSEEEFLNIQGDETNFNVIDRSQNWLQTPIRQLNTASELSAAHEIRSGMMSNRMRQPATVSGYGCFPVDAC